MTHEDIQAWMDDKRPQKELVEHVKKTVEDNKGVPMVEISTEILRCVCLLFDIHEKNIEELEKTVEDQKERITVLEEETKTKGTPQKVLNRKELADLIVGECPLCGALFNNEICPTACGWCGCLLDWKDGAQE